MTDDERKATAYHEAGHAVMGFVCNRPPKSVDIQPDCCGNAGHTCFTDDSAPLKRYLDCSSEKRQYLQARVLIALAGTTAHDLMCPGREHDVGDERDENFARALLRESVIWDAECDAALAGFKIQARKKMEQNWHNVEAIACALLTQNVLFANEMQSLLEARSPEDPTFKVAY